MLRIGECCKYGASRKALVDHAVTAASSHRTSSSHVSFRKSTYRHVDRAIVLRLNVDGGEASIEELLDCSIDELSQRATEGPTDYIFSVRRPKRDVAPLTDLMVVASGVHGNKRVLQYENGSVEVEVGGTTAIQAKPLLREVTVELGVSLLNGAGNPRNTRQLGAEILAALDGSPSRTRDE